MSKVAPGPPADASGQPRQWSGGDRVGLAIPELPVVTPPPAAPLPRSLQRTAAASGTRTLLGGDQVQLFLDAPPEQLYYAGESITGRVVFTPTSPVRLQDADVAIQCQASIKKVTGGIGDNVTYTSSLVPYECSTELRVPPRVAAGEVLTLPFSIAIPAHAPPTFLKIPRPFSLNADPLNASVTHTIRATVRANEFWLYKDVAAAAIFTVGSHAFSTLDPAEGSEDHEDCLPPYSDGVVQDVPDCCCCSGGLLALGIALPTRVLLIGSPRSHGQAQLSFASAVVPLQGPRTDRLLGAPSSTVQLVCVTTITATDKTHYGTITEVVAKTVLPAAPVGTPQDPLQLLASHLDLTASGAAMRPTTNAGVVTVAYHIEFSCDYLFCDTKCIPVLVTNNSAALPRAVPAGAASGSAKGKRSGKRDKKLGGEVVDV
jgi:hypothetical protein